MSNADQVALRHIVETTFGEVPSPAGTMTNLRFTGESLAQNTGMVASTEIRSDRQTPDVVRTGLSAGGDVMFELSYGAYDAWLASALMDDAWSSAVTVGPITTVSAQASDDSFNDSANGFGSIVANMWVHVSGFTDSANNGYFKVVTAAAGKITVDGSLVDEIAGDSVTIVQGAAIVNGTNLDTYVIEREYDDLLLEFAYYTGMAIDTFSLNVTPEAIITGSFGFVGKRETSSTATVGDGSPTAAATNDVMNAVDHVNLVYEASSSVDVTGISLNLANNLRSRLQVAELGPASLGAGKCKVTGTMTMYFADKAIMNKYLNATASSFAMALEDGSGNAYVLDLPRMKYTDGKRVAGGENTDIIADMAFEAYRHSTEDTTIRIARFAGS